MTCVEIDLEGYVYVMDPQPSDPSQCALVISQGNSALASPFALTPEQGTQIAMSILLVWAVAVVFRMLIRALSVDASQEN